MNLTVVAVAVFGCAAAASLRRKCELLLLHVAANVNCWCRILQQMLIADAAAVLFT